MINKLDLNPAINKCQFYAEITSGSPVVISDTEAQLEDVGVAKGVVNEDDDSANPMVADLCKAFMSAANAAEIASPNGNNDSEDIDPVDVYARPLITPMTTKAARCITRLLANRAANLINIPATRNVARELRTVAKAMKPHILQAPRVNDEHAQEQTNDLEQYAELIEDIAERISKLEVLNLRGTSVEFWALLQEFDEYVLHQIFLDPPELTARQDISLILSKSYKPSKPS
ncbi:hypothetical protein FRC09_011375 [Ceratobasidium sp. 395]|nr:hypothetical protein FRC09_011375 [Ceratobasidium sp. 395]